MLKAPFSKFTALYQAFLFTLAGADVCVCGNPHVYNNEQRVLIKFHFLSKSQRYPNSMGRCQEMLSHLKTVIKVRKKLLKTQIEITIRNKHHP